MRMWSRIRALGRALGMVVRGRRYANGGIIEPKGYESWNGDACVGCQSVKRIIDAGAPFAECSRCRCMFVSKQHYDEQVARAPVSAGTGNITIMINPERLADMRSNI